MKRGRRPPPLFDGRGRLTVFCRPSSSRPWLSSPLSVIPPFLWPSVARAAQASPVAALASARDRRRSSLWGTEIIYRLSSMASLGMACVHHPHTRCRLWTRSERCQAQFVGESQKKLCAIALSVGSEARRLGGRGPRRRAGANVRTRTTLTLHRLVRSCCFST